MYGHRGYGKASYSKFQELLKKTLKQDEFTFSGVLGACATLGMLAEGKEVHNLITRTIFEVNYVVSNSYRVLQQRSNGGQH